jgi:hypothetical protein
MSVDLRSRTSEDAVAVDAATFFEHTLPALIEVLPHLPGAGAAELGPRPLAIEVGERAWTLRLEGESVRVEPGAEGAAAIWVLDPDGLTDLVQDVRTPMGFFTGGDLELRAGRLEDTLDWWVVLRSLLDERPVHRSGDVEVPAHRTFAPDDDAADLAQFLHDAGYLHVAGLFSEDEMAVVSADMDVAMAAYTPDDGNSWWATTADGDERVVRMQRFQERSAATAALLTDPRLTRLGALTGDGHHLPHDLRDGNVIEALVKPVGVVAGISDVPWHKDCSLGGHSYRCCSMTIGVSVTGADATSGQLRVVAGSHRALVQPAFVRRDLDLPARDLPTRAGDVTVHLSCTLHMSQPPVDRERRVLYTSMRIPDPEGNARVGGELLGRGGELLGRIREGAHRTVSQRPGHVA